MTIDVSGIAFDLRSATAQSKTPIKLSHAQQCVAAALGHRSLASLQASGDAREPMDLETHILLDAKVLSDRRRELEIPTEDEQLLSAVTTAFRVRLIGISIHASLEDFEEALREKIEAEVIHDDNVISQTTVTNNAGLEDVYVPLEVDWDQVPANRDPLELKVRGQAVMRIDEERPYVGHRVDVDVSVWLARLGRAIWACTCRVTRARLDRGGEEDAQQPAVSLAEALAQTLDVTLSEAQELADAPHQELASDDGLVYGYVLDFSGLELSDALKRKLRERSPELQLTVGPHFMGLIEGREDRLQRHYVHGDRAEGDATQYYCASCDTFELQEHFRVKHESSKLVERYLASEKAWESRVALGNLTTRRPAQPPNCLREFVSSWQAEQNASRSAFVIWLLAQARRDDPIGDLAQDAARDRQFPSAASIDGIRSYLTRRGAARDAFEALEQAWAEFQGAGPAAMDAG